MNFLGNLCGWICRSRGAAGQNSCLKFRPVLFFHSLLVASLCVCSIFQMIKTKQSLQKSYIYQETSGPELHTGAWWVMRICPPSPPNSYVSFVELQFYFLLQSFSPRWHTASVILALYRHGFHDQSCATLVCNLTASNDFLAVQF